MRSGLGSPPLSPVWSDPSVEGRPGQPHNLVALAPGPDDAAKAVSAVLERFNVYLTPNEAIALTGGAGAFARGAVKVGGTLIGIALGEAVFPEAANAGEIGWFAQQRSIRFSNGLQQTGSVLKTLIGLDAGLFAGDIAPQDLRQKLGELNMAILRRDADKALMVFGYIAQGLRLGPDAVAAGVQALRKDIAKAIAQAPEPRQPQPPPSQLRAPYPYGQSPSQGGNPALQTTPTPATVANPQESAQQHQQRRIDNAQQAMQDLDALLAKTAPGAASSEKGFKAAWERVNDWYNSHQGDSFPTGFDLTRQLQTARDGLINQRLTSISEAATRLLNQAGQLLESGKPVPQPLMDKIDSIDKALLGLDQFLKSQNLGDLGQVWRSSIATLQGQLAPWQQAVETNKTPPQPAPTGTGTTGASPGIVTPPLEIPSPSRQTPLAPEQAGAQALLQESGVYADFIEWAKAHPDANLPEMQARLLQIASEKIPKFLEEWGDKLRVAFPAAGTPPSLGELPEILAPSLVKREEEWNKVMKSIYGYAANHPNRDANGKVSDYGESSLSRNFGGSKPPPEDTKRTAYCPTPPDIEQILQSKKYLNTDKFQVKLRFYGAIPEQIDLLTRGEKWERIVDAARGNRLDMSKLDIENYIQCADAEALGRFFDKLQTAVSKEALGRAFHYTERGLPNVGQIWEQVEAFHPYLRDTVKAVIALSISAAAAASALPLVQQLWNNAFGKPQMIGLNNAINPFSSLDNLYGIPEGSTRKAFDAMMHAQPNLFGGVNIETIQNLLGHPEKLDPNTRKQFHEFLKSLDSVEIPSAGERVPVNLKVYRNLHSPESIRDALMSKLGESDAQKVWNTIVNRFLLSKSELDLGRSALLAPPTTKGRSVTEADIDNPDALKEILVGRLQDAAAKTAMWYGYPVAGAHSIILEVNNAVTKQRFDPSKANLEDEFNYASRYINSEIPANIRAELDLVERVFWNEVNTLRTARAHQAANIVPLFDKNTGVGNTPFFSTWTETLKKAKELPDEAAVAFLPALRTLANVISDSVVKNEESGKSVPMGQYLEEHKELKALRDQVVSLLERATQTKENDALLTQADAAMSDLLRGLRGVDVNIGKLSYDAANNVVAQANATANLRLNEAAGKRQQESLRLQEEARRAEEEARRAAERQHQDTIEQSNKTRELNELAAAQAVYIQQSQAWNTSQQADRRIDVDDHGVFSAGYINGLWVMPFIPSEVQTADEYVDYAIKELNAAGAFSPPLPTDGTRKYTEQEAEDEYGPALREYFERVRREAGAAIEPMRPER